MKDENLMKFIEIEIEKLDHDTETVNEEKGKLSPTSNSSSPFVQKLLNNLFLNSEYMKNSIVLRLLRAVSNDLIEPMISCLISHKNNPLTEKKSMALVRKSKTHPLPFCKDIIGINNGKKKIKLKSASAAECIPGIFQKNSISSTTSKIVQKASRNLASSAGAASGTHVSRSNSNSESSVDNTPSISVQDSSHVQTPTPKTKKKSKISPRKQKSEQFSTDDENEENNLVKPNIISSESDDNECSEQDTISPRANLTPTKTTPKRRSSRFSSKKKKENWEEPILLIPQKSTEQINILQNLDGTFILRHRRKEDAQSSLFPCPLEIDWQAEFVLDNEASNIIAMYPKVIALGFSDEKLKEKWEQTILEILEDRLFSL